MARFGASGTIYDAPPARPFTFKVSDPDLQEPLGGGFQAAHVLVNNHGSNQYLWLPDAPDIVPPGVTRIVALNGTDVARASWKVPPPFFIVQPPQPVGAAILVFLNAGIDVSPDPGVTNRISTVEKALINPSVIVAGPSAAGQAVVSGLPDTSPFLVGGIVNILTQGGAGISQLALVKAVNASAGTITLNTNLGNPLVAGDIVSVVPVVLASNRKRAWDFTSGQAAGIGVGFQLILAGIAGQRRIVNHISVVILQISGAASGVTVTCRDGSSGGFIMWQTFTGVSVTVGDKDRIQEGDLALPGSVGFAVYTQMETAPAGLQGSVSIGGYNSIAEPT